jgi:hypothetical protein
MPCNLKLLWRTTFQAMNTCNSERSKRFNKKYRCRFQDRNICQAMNYQKHETNTANCMFVLAICSLEIHEFFRTVWVYCREGSIVRLHCGEELKFREHKFEVCICLKENAPNWNFRLQWNLSYIDIHVFGCRTEQNELNSMQIDAIFNRDFLKFFTVSSNC